MRSSEVVERGSEISCLLVDIDILYMLPPSINLSSLQNPNVNVEARPLGCVLFLMQALTNITTCFEMQRNEKMNLSNESEWVHQFTQFFSI